MIFLELGEPQALSVFTRVSDLNRYREKNGIVEKDVDFMD
jgi:hypothetical protein